MSVPKWANTVTPFSKLLALILFITLPVIMLFVGIKIGSRTATTQPPVEQTVEQTSYTACGCGCCGGTTPVKKCLYRSKGDRLQDIIQDDKQAAANPQCATRGCSLGTEYHYCD